MPDIERLEIGRRRNQAVTHNGVVYLSGHMPRHQPEGATPVGVTMEAKRATPRHAVEMSSIAAR
jgi:enamine deaminase RidA (YjgF/YER057c/UK114 family)